jgi:hypothetical protein
VWQHCSVVECPVANTPFSLVGIFMGALPSRIEQLIYMGGPVCYYHLLSLIIYASYLVIKHDKRCK